MNHKFLSVMPLISASTLDIVPNTLKLLNYFLLNQWIKMDERHPKSAYLLSSEWYSPRTPQKYLLYTELKDLWIRFEKKATDVYQYCILRETTPLLQTCWRSHGQFHICGRFPSAPTGWNDTSIWQLNCLLSTAL